MLQLSCAKCSALILKYQKDGPGILKRLYLDRIVEGKIPAKNLSCPSCKELLGTSMIYKKENRKAISLFQGSVAKKIVKL